MFSPTRSSRLTGAPRRGGQQWRRARPPAPAIALQFRHDARRRRPYLDPSSRRPVPGTAAQAVRVRMGGDWRPGLQGDEGRRGLRACGRRLPPRAMGA